MTPFGHGERSAAYATALARKLGLADESIDRVVTAARLHHIGYVALDEDEQTGHSPELMARLGGDILRETGLLSEIGDLVEAVQASSLGSGELDAAIVRVASGYDHLVRDDPLRARGALEIIAFRHAEEAERHVVAALRELVATEPGFIIEAIACGAPLTEAAAASGAMA
jgi:HD domain-containing protein